jgi:hypothetical protein
VPYGISGAAIRLAREGSDAALDLAGVAQADRSQLHSERRRRALDGAKLVAPAHGRSAHDRHSLHLGRDLLEQLQPFSADAGC